MYFGYICQTGGNGEEVLERRYWGGGTGEEVLGRRYWGWPVGQGQSTVTTGCGRECLQCG